MKKAKTPGLSKVNKTSEHLLSKEKLAEEQYQKRIVIPLCQP